MIKLSLPAIWVIIVCLTFFTITLSTESPVYSQTDIPGDSLVDKYKENRSVTYEEAIGVYQEMAESFEEASLREYGPTDSGEPLHLFVIDKDGLQNPSEIKQRGRTILLVNNGIHPGEPCGIDGSLSFANDLLKGRTGDEADGALNEITLAIVPVYNIGGARNRDCCSRVNQNGPESYGFRGNARNLDLNRDFIKADSRNAVSFSKLFQEWSPALFLDTHSTDGSDYQHVMTLIETQVDKLHHRLTPLVADTLTPELYTKMEENGYPLMPYALPYGQDPAKGLRAMLDSPRYATGYTSLFNTIGYVSEAHMLKPYEQRVEATKSIIGQLMKVGAKHQDAIQEAREEANIHTTKQDSFGIRWKVDSTRKDQITIQGYAAYTDTSTLTGQPIEYYDRSEPYSKEVPYYRYFEASMHIGTPGYYILPQAWQAAEERLRANGVEMYRLKRDTAFQVNSYYIKDYESRDQPYEGHFRHSSVDIEKRQQKRSFRKGDWVIPTDQTRNRYLVHVLDPRAEDSFFVWNFFDEILQQKEWFSPYVFEPKAKQILKKRPELKEAFEEKRQQDSTFAQSNWRQLYFIYQRSRYYEEEHNRYPVALIDTIPDNGLIRETSRKEK